MMEYLSYLLVVCDLAMKNCIVVCMKFVKCCNMCNGLRDSGLRQCVMNQKIPGSKPTVWLPKLCTNTGGMGESPLVENLLPPLRQTRPFPHQITISML